MKQVLDTVFPLCNQISCIVGLCQIEKTSHSHEKICQKEYISIQSQHATLIRKEEQHNIMVCV
jgi:hypothetical protein